MRFRRSPNRRYRLQDNYDSFEEFKAYCRIYNNHTRLGFKSMKAAWDANPVVEVSTNPAEYRVVTDRRFTRATG